MPKRKTKQVEANDGSYGGAVLAAFDAMDQQADSDGAVEKPVTIALTLSEDQAWALAQMCKRFGHGHATELSNAYDGGFERDQMIEAVIKLQRALRDNGWSPR